MKPCLCWRLPYCTKRDRSFAISETRVCGLSYQTVEELPFGTWEVILPVKPKTVVAYGPDVYGESKKLWKSGLAGKIKTNARFIKPVDYELLKNLATQKIHLFVYEQVIETSSLATMIKSAIPEVSVTSLALPETFLDTGKVEELKALHHITYSDLIKVLKE